MLTSWSHTGTVGRPVLLGTLEETLNWSAGSVNNMFFIKLASYDLFLFFKLSCNFYEQERVRLGVSDIQSLC